MMSHDATVAAALSPMGICDFAAQSEAVEAKGAHPNTNDKA